MVCGATASLPYMSSCTCDACAADDDLHCAAMRRGRIVVLDVAPLVTDVIDLADVPEAFRGIERPSAQCKV